MDSRTHLTKTDWSTWSATLADSRSKFESMIAPIYAYLDHTTSRLPLVDSYVTDDIHSSGFRARPVIGGVFIKMLAKPHIWDKWSKANSVAVNAWTSDLPPKPRITTLVPTSKRQAQMWSYTTSKPGSGWSKPNFDASAWK